MICQYILLHHMYIDVIHCDGTKIAIISGYTVVAEDMSNFKWPCTSLHILDEFRHGATVLLTAALCSSHCHTDTNCTSDKSMHNVV